MEHIQNSLSNCLKSLMVQCMLNPNNKDFYIGTLTIERVQQILLNFNDPEFTQLFWDAFEVAQAELNCQILAVKHGQTLYVCPECRCLDYVPGAKCPNCDYEEV